MADNEQRVRAFFERWGVSFEAFSSSFLEIMADDCLLVQPGIPDVVGPRETIALLQAGRDAHGIETIKVDVPRLVVSGDCIVSERVDHLVRGDGSVAASVPVLGIMDFRDGKISAWREYFDSTAVPRL